MLQCRLRSIISTLVSTDASPNAPLTSPSHGSTEEVSNLRDFLNTQRALKLNRQEEGSASETGLPYERTANHDVDVDNGSGGSNGDADKPSWIGTMIKAPAGERGRGTNAHGRLGYKNEDILRLTGITHQKWAQYMVSNINILFRTILLIHYSLLPTDLLITTSIS